MNSRYDHQSVHLQKPIFLPIICRLSIKDVEPNNQHQRRRRIQSLDLPSSPRVSCIGQVKRDNRITVLPANLAAPPPPTANHHKQKLKKPRSNGTLMLSTANGGARGGISRSCRTSKEETLVNNNPRRVKLTNDDYRQDCVKVVNIGELDPPLPVVKRVAPPPGVGRDEVNLWRRRCLSGAELKSLQIKQKHQPNEPLPSTV